MAASGTVLSVTLATAILLAFTPAPGFASFFSQISERFHHTKQDYIQRSELSSVVQFYLFPDPSNFNSSDQITTGDKRSLTSSRFNKYLPTIFLIHGFKNNYTTGFSRTLIEAYLTTNFPANIIDVNWEGAIPYDGNNFIEDVLYPKAVSNVPPTARKIVDFINFMMKENAIIRADQIHLVGFSLGAHVAGITGYLFQSQQSSKIQRITGLDPAGPLFRNKDLSERLDPSDAIFVDVIHTNKGRKGNSELLGTVDFFPNGGGPEQPGCSSTSTTTTSIKTDAFGTCSHAASYKYFAMSIYGKNIKACKCGRDLVLTCDGDGDGGYNGRCIDATTFGQYCPQTAQGTYYLRINLV